MVAVRALHRSELLTRGEGLDGLAARDRRLRDPFDRFESAGHSLLLTSEGVQCACFPPEEFRRRDQIAGNRIPPLRYIESELKDQPESEELGQKRGVQFARCYSDELQAN